MLRAVRLSHRDLQARWRHLSITFILTSDGCGRSCKCPKELSFIHYCHDFGTIPSKWIDRSQIVWGSFKRWRRRSFKVGMEDSPERLLFVIYTLLMTPLPQFTYSSKGFSALEELAILILAFRPHLSHRWYVTFMWLSEFWKTLL